MRITITVLLLAPLLALIGCTTQAPLKVDDRQATALLVGHWSRAPAHWTFTGDGEGVYETLTGTDHAPFAHEFRWRVENAVLHIEYEAPIEKGKNRRYRYNIQELTEGKLVLQSQQEDRPLVLINDSF
ncbi:lipocalin family protein [Exilibacterium tricleocarpae]|uniref:Lipocalin family protein n=1 Tax=Exilibacterium tricleocarpae TaxID=2591008 RepID=A0A545TFU2_9GAMM|nr:lipocalin family protein [Exilibacterium tricleocarpae]TQV76068.1 lipocalin family protein [Exilibacterium tricleocarpae]